MKKVELGCIIRYHHDDHITITLFILPSMTPENEASPIQEMTDKRIRQWELGEQSGFTPTLERMVEDARQYWPSWTRTDTGKRRKADAVFRMFLRPQIDAAVLDYLFDIQTQEMNKGKVGLRRGFLERKLGGDYINADADQRQMAHWLLEARIKSRNFNLPEAPLNSLLLPRIKQAGFLCFKGLFALTVAIEELVEGRQSSTEMPIYLNDITKEETDRLLSLLYRGSRNKRNEFALEYLYDRVDPLIEAKYVAIESFGLPLGCLAQKEKKNGIFLDETGQAVVVREESTERATIEHLRMWLTGMGRFTSFELTRSRPSKNQKSIFEAASRGDQPAGSGLDLVGENNGTIFELLISSEKNPSDVSSEREEQDAERAIQQAGKEPSAPAVETNEEQGMAKTAFKTANNIVGLPDDEMPLRKCYLLRQSFGGIEDEFRPRYVWSNFKKLTYKEIGWILGKDTSSSHRLCKKAERQIDKGTTNDDLCRFIDEFSLLLVLTRSDAKRKGLYHCWIRNTEVESSLAEQNSGCQKRDEFRDAFRSEVKLSRNEFLKLADETIRPLTVGKAKLLKRNPIMFEIVEFARSRVLDKNENVDRGKVWDEFAERLKLRIKNQAPRGAADA